MKVTAREVFGEAAEEEAREIAAVRAWVEKTRVGNGWPAPVYGGTGPLGWLDDLHGAVTYPPATGWLLRAMDYPKKWGTAPYVRAMESVVPRGVGPECEWVMAVRAEILRRHEQGG